MREYHIDTYHKFSHMTTTMSVRYPPNSRPVMIVGQDESCFKQYSFSKRCWVGPNGHQEVIEGWCGRPKGMLQVLCWLGRESNSAGVSRRDSTEIFQLKRRIQRRSSRIVLEMRWNS